MAVNRECIFGTRPWKVYGEGRKSAKAGAGNFNEGKGSRYTAEDIRFTTKGNTLYAVALAWPASGKLVVKTLGKNQAGLKGEIHGVQLLGCADKLAWERTDAGLSVTLPAQQPCEGAWVLKVEGLDLAASQPVECMTVIPFFVRADKGGALHCNADDADVHGKKLKLQGHGNKSALARWNDFGDYATWPVADFKPGKYEVSASVGSQNAANTFAVEIGGQTVTGTAPKTENWDAFTTVKLGKIEIGAGGNVTVTVRPAGDPKLWKAINLHGLTLKPVK
jgi:alpha-L-fucosidase